MSISVKKLKIKQLDKMDNSINIVLIMMIKIEDNTLVLIYMKSLNFSELEKCFNENSITKIRIINSVTGKLVSLKS